jgi:hypothetical protein
MANIIKGKFTIKQVLIFTKRYFKNRFKYERRDVLKRVYLRKIINLKSDRAGEPTIKYEVTTYSYPQYKPYLNLKGIKSKKQRKLRHEYDVTLQMDRMSLNTTHWKARLGSQARWVKKVNNKLIGKLTDRDKEKLQKKIEKKLRRDKVKITKTRLNTEMKKEIKKIKDKRKYINIGDYNARKKGINADFLFRCEYVYRKYGHLYGMDQSDDIQDNKRVKRPPKITNPRQIIFFPKHLIRLIEYLMIKGKLKNN